MITRENTGKHVGTRENTDLFYSRETILYLGREIEVKYDYQGAEESTNTGEDVTVISIRYEGRDITRMVNQWAVGDIILDKLR